MSADNYVVVRKFGENDYRWGVFFASDEPTKVANESFTHGPFKTPREAADHAEECCQTIEYGISFEYGCLIGEKWGN